MAVSRKRWYWQLGLIVLALVLTVCLELRYLPLRGEPYSAVLWPYNLWNMTMLWVILSAIISFVFFFVGKARKHNRIFTRSTIATGIAFSILFSVFLDYIDEHVGWEGKSLDLSDVFGLLMYSTAFFMVYSLIVFMIREQKATR